MILSFKGFCRSREKSIVNQFCGRIAQIAGFAKDIITLKYKLIKAKRSMIKNLWKLYSFPLF
jgi:hypothetical protein